MNKDPLSVYLPKLILTVSVIVSFGALAGAIGYLVSHPLTVIVPIVNPPVEDFYSCTEDSDCIAVKNDCCGCTAGGTATAINKNFRDQWGNNCEAAEPVYCPAVMSSDPSCINTEPRCAGNKCVLKEPENTETERKSAIVGEDFLITLDANPSTGYSWEAEFDKNYLTLRSKDFVLDSGPDWVGKSGEETFTFTPLKAGEITITMNYGRSWENKPIETKFFKYNIKEKTIENQEVAIATDKTGYEQGEIIKISVSNGLDKPILYSDNGDRFWGIEYFEDNKWINFAYREDSGFRLTEKNIGDFCSILFYERVSPKKLSSQSDLAAQWNQKICPFGTESLDKPKIVKYMESGKYRLVFYYGFEISSTDSFKISEPKTIYSNEFTIK